MTEPQPPRSGPHDVPPAYGTDPFAPVDYPADNAPPSGYPPLPPPVYANPGYPPQAYPPPPPGWPQQPYAPGYYDPYNYGAPLGAPPGTNGKAITALVCGALGLVLCMCFIPSVLAIIFGFLGLSETRRSGQSGGGLAIAGIVLGGLTLLLGVFFFAMGSLDFH